jgi:hypothetical protein
VDETRCKEKNKVKVKAIEHLGEMTHTVIKAKMIRLGAVHPKSLQTAH